MKISGYIVKKTIFEENNVKEISLSQDTITLNIGETKTIEIKSIYYVEIDKKNHKVTLNDGKINISPDSTELGEDVITSAIQIASDNVNVEATLEGKIISITDVGNKATNAQVVIKCGNYTKICNISVVKKPPENRKENWNLVLSTEYGLVDIIWLDNSNNVVSEPNKPILEKNGEKMIPIKWDKKSNLVETNENDSNWYNYNLRVWANAKTKNDSYFVWIPRFAYRIIYYSDSTYSKITAFWDGLGLWNSETGESRGTIDDGLKIVDYNNDKYIVHPAFETNLDVGGWDSQLSGIWVAKFEVSGKNENLKVTYGVSSERNQTLGEQYISARKATYGYKGTNDSDGNTSFMNSHMMKNSEWGAVAYLSNSKYGRNGVEVTKNSSDQYTGGGSGSAYINNGNQSSTGNVYGIYDLAGGAWERVAIFNSYDNNNYISSSKWTQLTGLSKDSSSTKYATKYNNSTGVIQGTGIIYTVGKIGDATKEAKIYEKEYAWFGDIAAIVSSEYPFLSRGGGYSDSNKNCGIFYSGRSDGKATKYDSFRTVLCP